MSVTLRGVGETAGLVGRGVWWWAADVWRLHERRVQRMHARWWRGSRGFNVEDNGVSSSTQRSISWDAGLARAHGL